MRMAVKRFISIIILVCFGFIGAVYGADTKEELKQYIMKLNPILTNVQVAARNINQKYWSPDAASKQMRGYINELRALVPPESVIKQHKMLLLSLEKLEKGFAAFSKNNRPLSITLVKRGAGLLRIAVKDIVDLAKREGIVKNPEENK